MSLAVKLTVQRLTSSLFIAFAVSFAACGNGSSPDAAGSSPSSSGAPSAPPKQLPKPSGSEGAPTNSATPASSNAAAPSAAPSSSATAGSVKRRVDPFDVVHIESSLEADIDIGPAAPLEIAGDPDVVAAVLTDVKDGVLTIHLPSGSFSMTKPLKVHIVAPEIKGLSALSSSTIDAKGLNAVSGLTAHAESSAKMTLVGKCKTLDASEHLERLAHKSDGYREAHLETDELVRVATDGLAPPDCRVGAALLLAKQDEPTRQRVRFAIDASADDQLKTALAQALEGEIAEPELEAAEERARRQT